MQFDIPPGFFLRTSLGSVNFADYFSGMYKCPFFGAIIALIGCHFGLITRGGTEGVGQATTRTVVAISIAILIADFFLTKVSILIFPGALTCAPPSAASSPRRSRSPAARAAPRRSRRRRERDAGARALRHPVGATAPRGGTTWSGPRPAARSTSRIPAATRRARTTPCPLDLQVGERIRIAGKTCLRESGDPARVLPVVCPDPLTNLEKRDLAGRAPPP